jgi:GTPase
MGSAIIVGKIMKKIALVGRPNVGKSALFNRIVKRRIAIVDEQEGVTRDRLYAQTDLFGKMIEMIDTGGIDPRSELPFNDEVKMQAMLAIEEADSLIQVVDATTGPTELDIEVARILQKTNKPVILAVNKVDNDTREIAVHDFYVLGIKKVVGVSALHGSQVAELLETATEPLCFDEEEEEEDDSIKVAIIGRPNVGKSTLLNYVLGENRAAVSPVAGTTRDSIDVKVVIDGQKYTLIDTAGVRRKVKETNVIEKFASIRTERAIKRSDVCILLLDSEDGLTTQEKHIERQIEESGKGCVIAFNKWDIIKGYRMEHCRKRIRDESSFLNHCPIHFMSAKTGRNVLDVFASAKEVSEHLVTRISTSPLNTLMGKAQQRVSPPMIRGKRLRVYYLSQVGISPPRFVLFINHEDRMTESYRRYLYNSLRKEYPFTGCPIEFSLKNHRDPATSRR